MPLGRVHGGQRPVDHRHRWSGHAGGLPGGDPGHHPVVNCASLQIINNEDRGEPLGGATFSDHAQPASGGHARPARGRHSDIFDDSNGNTTSTGANYDDPDATAGRITLPAVVPDVRYTITETSPPAGYIGAASSQKITPVPFSGDNA